MLASLLGHSWKGEKRQGGSQQSFETHFHFPKQKAISIKLCFPVPVANFSWEGAFRGSGCELEKIYQFKNWSYSSLVFQKSNEKLNPIMNLHDSKSFKISQECILYLFLYWFMSTNFVLVVKYFLSKQEVCAGHIEGTSFFCQIVFKAMKHPCVPMWVLSILNSMWN